MFKLSLKLLTCISFDCSALRSVLLLNADLFIELSFPVFCVSSDVVIELFKASKKILSLLVLIFERKKYFLLTIFDSSSDSDVNTLLLDSNKI